MHQEQDGNRQFRDDFLEIVVGSISASGKNYLPVIQGLAAEESEKGIRWLQGIVDNITEDANRLVPSLL
jgi:hypothetical protein